MLMKYKVLGKATRNNFGMVVALECYTKAVPQLIAFSHTDGDALVDISSVGVDRT